MLSAKRRTEQVGNKLLVGSRALRQNFLLVTLCDFEYILEIGANGDAHER